MTVAPGQSLQEARGLMARHKVRRLPVVADGRLVGIIAQADLALADEPPEVGETLVEISQPAPTAWE